MSDIEFLSIKKFDGKLITKEGSLDGSTGDLVTHTASSGKDMYIGKAKVNFESDDVGKCTVKLKVNGTSVETVDYRGLSTDNFSEYEFVNIGQKVATTEIIKIEVTDSDPDIKCEGTLIVFEEATGESPQIT